MFIDFSLDAVRQAVAHQSEGKGRYYALKNHGALLKSVQNADAEQLPITSRYLIHAYLRNVIYFHARENGNFIHQTYTGPLGEFSLRAINEKAYPLEISAMHKIKGNDDFSPFLKDAISRITASCADRLSGIAEFREDMARWSLKAGKINLAYGYMYVFAEAANDILPFRVNKIPIFETEDVSGNFACYAPQLGHGSEMELHIAVNPRDVGQMSGSAFFSLLHHEGIHGLLNQLGQSHFETPFEASDLKKDAELYAVRKKYNVTASEIPSLYFGDCEEVICYTNQYALLNQIRRFEHSNQIPFMPNPPQ